MTTDEEDEFQLSLETLAILEQFKREKQEQDEKFQKLKAQSEKAHELKAKLTMLDFKEDWQLSQFWYTEDTSNALAQEAISQTLAGQRIGCIASPSVYTALKKIEHDREPFVLEYDKRFNVFDEEFIFYDFNEPLAIDKSMRNSFDFLVIDPPFLSNACWSKVIQTAKYLIKEKGKIMVCTGLVMKELIASELDCQLCEFQIEHANGLSNEFGCYLNYTSKNPQFGSIKIT